MPCQHGSNEFDIFGLPDDEKYVDEIDTGGEPLRGQDSQPTQIENIAHSRHLRREEQTAQYSAADAENIAHSRRLHREDQTARHSAAAIKK
jgi:hypothetical protein